MENIGLFVLAANAYVSVSYEEAMKLLPAKLNVYDLGIGPCTFYPLASTIRKRRTKNEIVGNVK